MAYRAAYESLLELFPQVNSFYALYLVSSLFIMSSFDLKLRVGEFLGTKSSS